MKLDRLMGVLTYLLQHDRATARELAERFEVSRRTILRDVEALNLAGIPVVTTQGGDGGIAIMEGYRLDRSALTADELSGILTGLKSLATVSRSGSLEKLIQKLSPETHVVSPNDHVLIDLSSYYRDSLSEKFQLIQEAIAEGRLISFDYYYEKGEARRLIEPCCLQFKWMAWYVVGWCRDRQGFRRFKLNRLWNARLEEERFAPRKVPAEELYGDVNLEEPFQVRLLFDKSVRFRLIEEYGLHCYRETEEGLLVEMCYANRKYMKNWVLSFGAEVTVLGPPDFLKEIREAVWRAAEKYPRE